MDLSTSPFLSEMCTIVSVFPQHSHLAAASQRRKEQDASIISHVPLPQVTMNEASFGRHTQRIVLVCGEGSDLSSCVPFSSPDFYKVLR